MKKGIENLRDSHPEITRDKLPGRYLVTDGVDVFFQKDGEPLENLTKGRQLAFAFIVEIQEIHDQVSEAISRQQQTAAK